MRVREPTSSKDPASASQQGNSSVRPWTSPPNAGKHCHQGFDVYDTNPIFALTLANCMGPLVSGSSTSSCRNHGPLTRSSSAALGQKRSESSLYALGVIPVAIVYYAWRVHDAGVAALLCMHHPRDGNAAAASLDSTRQGAYAQANVHLLASPSYHNFDTLRLSTPGREAVLQTSKHARPFTQAQKQEKGATNHQSRP